MAESLGLLLRRRWAGPPDAKRLPEVSQVGRRAEIGDQQVTEVGVEADVVMQMGRDAADPVPHLGRGMPVDPELEGEVVGDAAHRDLAREREVQVEGRDVRIEQVPVEAEARGGLDAEQPVLG